MSRIMFTGPFSLRLRSFLALSWIAVTTHLRHACGRQIAPDWDANFEIGVRFWRHQFAVALSGRDIARGRERFDSLQTETDDRYDVTVEPVDNPKGDWYRPVRRRGNTVVLHFHGGGYAFHGGISRRYAAMLAHHFATPVFVPDYRLTPEHPHPAQADDAFAAWRYVTEKVPADRVVVSGDSAGGHMALMLLQSLKAEGLPQPALCIGLSPWTDIGDRGKSLRSNDRYDLVQGWMAIRFGEWLDPKGRFGRECLSPISHDYSGLCPIYIQAGGREVLRDMIIDFVDRQEANGAEIALEIWHDMPHNFQAYDSLKVSSAEALEKLATIVESRHLSDTFSES